MIIRAVAVVCIVSSQFTLSDECYGAEVVSEGAVGVAAGDGVCVCALWLWDALAGSVPAVGGVGGVEDMLAAAVVDVEAVAVGDEGEKAGAESAAAFMAIDDDVGDVCRGVCQLGEGEQEGVGEFDPLAATVVDADAIAVGYGSTAHLAVGVAEIGAAAHGETVVFLHLAVRLAAIEDEGVGEEGGVNVEREGDGGVGSIIAELGDAEALGGVAVCEAKADRQREGAEGVGGVADFEPAVGLGDEGVGEQGVHEEGTFGSEVETMEAIADAEAEAIAAHAVGHVDVAVPTGTEQPRAAVGMKGEHGVVVIGRERAGLIAAVESEDAEAVLDGGIADILRTEIGGAEAAPDGVVVATGAACADIVAHHISVGAGLPAEEDAPRQGIDRTETQGTGRSGEVVLMIEANGVGTQHAAVGHNGCNIIVDGVGTNGSAEGVEKSRSRKSNDLMIRIARILPTETVVCCIRDFVPPKKADMGSDNRSGMDAEGALRLSGCHETEHQENR